MAKRQNGVNKSEMIRQLLRDNPDMPVKEVVSTMAARGLKVTDNLVYFQKGKLKGRSSRHQKARQLAANVALTTVTADPVAMIRKVKSWANEVGGLKKLKALVDVLSE